MISSAVTTSLLAEGSLDEAGLRQHVVRSLKMICVILVPAVVLIVLLADKFLLLYGTEYSRNAAVLLRWLLIAALPQAVNTVYFSVKRVRKQLKPVIVITALAAAVTLALAYILMPRLGINGVGIAWLAGQLAVAAVVGWKLARGNK